MGISKKIAVTSLIISGIVSLLILFAVNPIFRQIKAESGKLVIQKKEIFESEIKIKNIQDFKDNFGQYQPNLNKMSELFISISEPIEFIKFLESEAVNSRLSIEINPPILKKNEGDPWQSLEFGLNLKGSFANFLRFFERLDFSPYLIEPLSLTIREDPDKKVSIISALSIKVYAK